MNNFDRENAVQKCIHQTLVKSASIMQPSLSMRRHFLISHSRATAAHSCYGDILLRTASMISALQFVIVSTRKCVIANLSIDGCTIYFNKVLSFCLNLTCVICMNQYGYKKEKNVAR